MDPDTRENSADDAAKATEGINRTSFSDYVRNRSTTFDYAAAIRRKSQPVSPPDEQLEQPEVVEAYELALRGVDHAGVTLWPLVSKAKDLLGLFNGVTGFSRWYNSTPGSEPVPVLEVNHPRLQIHREFDDLHVASRDNGIVGLIENQSPEELVLEDWHSWYGWAVSVPLPVKIAAYQTGFFNWSYSGPFWHTAAVGLKYTVGNTGWFAYIAVYTSRLSSNYCRVILSKPSITWDHLYDSMQRNTSFSKPADGTFFLSSQIDLAYRAKAVAQLGTVQHQKEITTLEYMFGKWLTPKDYKDEL
jgi:hypothetical protein